MGKSPYSVAFWVPIKAKMPGKGTSKDWCPISDYQWHHLDLFCWNNKLGPPLLEPLARTQGQEHWPAVKWATWTRTWTPGFSSKCTEFRLSLWISSSDIWKKKCQSECHPNCHTNYIQMCWAIFTALTKASQDYICEWYEWLLYDWVFSPQYADRIIF